jgi:hypothetical protein
MKVIFASACLLVLASLSPAEATGCIKGAVGHHEANKPNPNNSNAQAPSEQK